MSNKILKSSQVILNNKKYVLSNKVVLDDVVTEKSSDIDKESIKEEYKETVDEIIHEAQLEAKDIVQEADSERNDILSSAQQESQNLREKAYKEGYEEGEMAGYEEGKKIAQGMIDEALQIKNDMLSAKETFLSDIEPELITLVVNTVEKILNKEIKENKETIDGLIKKGIEKCAYTEKIDVRVSPEDYDYVLEHKNRILTYGENINDLKIINDTALKAGSCIIETESGIVDSSIEVQFNKIKSEFQELLKSE